MIFRKYPVWLTRIFGNYIDYSCFWNSYYKIEYPWSVTMECLSLLSGRSSIGKDVYLLTNSHDVNCQHYILITRRITIGSAVWLATGCKVLPRICIADGVVASAASLIRKDVDPWTVVGGNPAKFLKKEN